MFPFPAIKKVTAILSHTVCLFLILSISFSACSNKEDVIVDPPPASEATKPSGEVMMQTFYWDVPAGGTWWDVINGKVASWQSAGITMLWLPPVSKAQSGGFSMGYDPYDYFDFGKYDQHGTVETRFGSESELLSLISNAKAKGMKLIADIVINHNSGGDLEFNPNTNTSYYTKFTPKSGKFNRTYEHFHPNAIHGSDEGGFGGFPDLCHDVNYVKDWLWRRDDGVAKYYKNNLGFDGWRFDYVKGFSPNVVKEWNASVGGISIGEYYDGDVNLVNNWSKAANSAAFDFPLMFALRD
ncbi:MAG TPA: alpha-amylase family glycosyl hydrolase, partial [Chitinophagaceae bacterium]|nr:alpha-amylase family glycosyl hydrolase [Chitinophagaceae bacterium]